MQGQRSSAWVRMFPLVPRMRKQDWLLQQGKRKNHRFLGGVRRWVKESCQVCRCVPQRRCSTLFIIESWQEAVFTNVAAPFVQDICHTLVSLGAERLSQGFAKGAEATGRAIHRGAAKIRDHLSPEDTPSEVSPHVSKGLQVARKATGGAARVSQLIGMKTNPQTPDIPSIPEYMATVNVHLFS